MRRRRGNRAERLLFGERRGHVWVNARCASPDVRVFVCCEGGNCTESLPWRRERAFEKV